MTLHVLLLISERNFSNMKQEALALRCIFFILITSITKFKLMNHSLIFKYLRKTVFLNMAQFLADVGHAHLSFVLRRYLTNCKLCIVRFSNHTCFLMSLSSQFWKQASWLILIKGIVSGFFHMCSCYCKLQLIYMYIYMRLFSVCLLLLEA